MTPPGSSDRLEQEISEAIYDYLQQFDEPQPWEESEEIDIKPFVQEKILPLIASAVATAKQRQLEDLWSYLFATGEKVTSQDDWDRVMRDWPRVDAEVAKYEANRPKEAIDE